MRVNGKQLAVEIEGPKTGPTDSPERAILFIHGLGGTSNLFQVQAEALTDQFQVIRPDLAGAGRSAGVDPISVSSHVEDLAAILDALDAESAFVVGHSMGTLLARTLAARYPEKVSGLALLGAVRELTEPERRAQRERASLLRHHGTAGVAPAAVAGALSETTRRARPVIAAFVRELVMRQNAEGYARNCEALSQATDPGPIDPGLPLLLITGADDRIGPPAVSAELAAAHGNASLEILPAVGHWTPLEAATEVAELLLKFI